MFSVILYINDEDYVYWTTSQWSVLMGEKNLNLVLVMSSFFLLFASLSEVNLKQRAVESGVTVGVILMHYKAQEVMSQ